MLFLPEVAAELIGRDRAYRRDLVDGVLDDVVGCGGLAGAAGHGPGGYGEGYVSVREQSGSVDGASAAGATLRAGEGEGREEGEGYEGGWGEHSRVCFDC